MPDSQVPEELEQEVTAINSIYGNGTLSQLTTNPIIYALVLPMLTSISLRVEYPNNYPDAPPSVLGTQSVGDEAKGEGTFLVELVRGILADIYIPGVPCIFDVVEEAGQKIEQFHTKPEPTIQQLSTAETDGQHELAIGDASSHSDNQQRFIDLGDSPPWVLSEVVSEKKSVFIARAAPVATVQQAKRYLGHLLASDKKVAKATHNITAWRIRGRDGVQYQDCDDDGETAAGGRLLHLLELMNIWDCMVVVTRWYGGVQLGPDRFRIINQTARDAVVKAGFAQEATKQTKEGDKKKSKK